MSEIHSSSLPGVSYLRREIDSGPERSVLSKQKSSKDNEDRHPEHAWATRRSNCEKTVKKRRQKNTAISLKRRVGMYMHKMNILLVCKPEGRTGDRDSFSESPMLLQEGTADAQGGRIPNHHRACSDAPQTASATRSPLDTSHPTTENMRKLELSRKSWDKPRYLVGVYGDCERVRRASLRMRAALP